MVIAQGDRVKFKIFHSNVHSLHREGEKPHHLGKAYFVVQQAGSVEQVKTEKRSMKGTCVSQSASPMTMAPVSSSDKLASMASTPASPSDDEAKQDNLSLGELSNPVEAELEASDVFMWDQVIEMPPIEYSIHSVRFWFSLYEAHTLRKDTKIAEGDLIIDDELDCINKGQLVTVVLKRFHKPHLPHSSSNNLQEQDVEVDEDKQENKETTKVPPVTTEEPVIGSLLLSVKILRDESFVVAKQLEENSEHTRIELGNWHAEDVLIKKVKSEVEIKDVEPPLGDVVKNWSKYWISKSLMVYLPETWKVKKNQTVNKDAHTHYSAWFWSDRCLGPETGDVEILSVVYQKVCAKNQDDFELTKHLYETMVTHTLQSESLNGAQCVIKGKDETAKYGVDIFDSVSLYHYKFVKRIGFVELDNILYIMKPKGLDLMLCISMESSFGITEKEHELIQQVAKSAVIIY